jgi:hypothetical protein
MRSVTLTKMRRGALVLAAAAVMVGMRMFSAAPAMADPLVITEPAQPVMNETILDDGLGLIGLDNDFDFVNFDDSGLVSFDHDLDHANVDHDSDHANADNR